MKSLFLLAAASFLLPLLAYAQQDSAFLADRGPGLSTSMFGTYIQKGEIILYPFVEYYYDKNAEYKPAEFGYGLEEDYEGFYKATEGLLFVSYGIKEWLAIEMEAAVIDAT